MARARPEPELDLGLPADAAPEVNAGPTVIPVLFTDFCAWIGVTLYDGQRVAARVAFDGIQPSDLDDDERAVFREMFGDLETVTPEMRRQCVFVCGGRGGKTYVFASLRILHLALTVPLDSLAPGQVASAPIIAPDMALAKEALNFVQGAIASKPELLKMVVGKPDAEESVEIARDGHAVEIVIRSASGKGRTGRGRSLVGAVMEECAFFYDKDHKVNDKEIREAISPRLDLPGAQLIMSSTPWAQTGELHALFVANHPDPSVAGIADVAKCEGTALAMHATTVRLRPTMQSIVEAEYTRDPDNAAREYGARFMSAGVDAFFDPITIGKCVDDALEIPFLPAAGDQVASGGDLAFTKNSSALVITHRRFVTLEEVDATTGKPARKRRGLISVADILEKKPEEGVSLKPSQVVKEQAARINAHHGSYLMADAHYRETAIEHLSEAGLGFLDAPTDPSEAFVATRTEMRENRVRIPNHPRLIRQLRETMVRHIAGGRIRISHPIWKTGEHGDIAAAFALAVYQAAGETVPEPKTVEGTPEAFAAQAKEIQSKRRDGVRRQHEGGGPFKQRWPGR